MTSRIFGSSTPPKSPRESESQIKTSASPKDRNKERVRQHLGSNALKSDTSMEQFLDKLDENGISTADGAGVRALYEGRYRKSEQIRQKQLSSGEAKQARRTNKEERPQNKKSTASPPRPMKRELTASTPRQVRQAQRPKPEVAPVADAPTSWFDDFSKGVSNLFTQTNALLDKAPPSETSPLSAYSRAPIGRPDLSGLQEETVSPDAYSAPTSQTIADDSERWAASLASQNLPFGSKQFEDFKSFCEMTLQVAKNAKNAGEHEVAAEAVVRSLCAAGQVANFNVCLDLLELTHRLESDSVGVAPAYTEAAHVLVAKIEKEMDGFLGDGGECERKDLLSDLQMADKVLSRVCANYPWPCENLAQMVVNNQARVLRAGMAHLAPDQLETLFASVKSEVLTREILQSKLFVECLIAQPKWNRENLDFRGAGAAAGNVFLQDFKVATQFLNQRAELLSHLQTVEALVQCYLKLHERGKHVVLKQLSTDPLFSELFKSQSRNSRIDDVLKAIAAFRKNPGIDYKGPMNIVLFGAMTREIEGISKKYAKQSDLQLEPIAAVINREIEKFFAALETAPDAPSEDLLKEREGTSQAIATLLSIMPSDVLSRTISSSPAWVLSWIRCWFDNENEVTRLIAQRLADAAM